MEEGVSLVKQRRENLGVGKAIMNLIHKRRGVEDKDLTTEGSFSVNKVNESRFETKVKAAKKKSGYQRVGMDDFGSCGLKDRKILNMSGGSTCLLVCVVDNIRGDLHWGHFSNVGQKFLGKMTELEVKDMIARSSSQGQVFVPAEEDWKRLNMLLPPMSEEGAGTYGYKSLMDRAIGHDGNGVEVYLFGEYMNSNANDQEKELVVNLNEQHSITTDLLKRGVPLGKIFDFRQHGNLGVDNLLIDLVNRNIWLESKGKQDASESDATDRQWVSRRNIVSGIRKSMGWI